MSLPKRLVYLLESFRILPSKESFPSFLLTLCIYAAVTIPFGVGSGLLTFQLYSGSIRSLITLPFILLIIPSIPEELFCRGLLLPHPKEKTPRKQARLWIVFSITLFVLWHPFAALTTYKVVKELFTDIRFIVMVLLLAITCTVTYLRSGSIWYPIIVHWLTVLVWMLFLGGRNFAIDMM